MLFLLLLLSCSYELIAPHWNFLLFNNTNEPWPEWQVSLFSPLLWLIVYNIVPSFVLLCSTQVSCLYWCKFSYCFYCWVHMNSPVRYEDNGNTSFFFALTNWNVICFLETNQANKCKSTQALIKFSVLGISEICDIHVYLIKALSW